LFHRTTNLGKKQKFIICYALQVQGTLRPKNVYSPPFEPICAICNHPIFALALPPNAHCYCSTCDKDTDFLFSHSICCVLQKKDSNIECTVRRPLLDELLPELIEISYEDYQKDISSALDLLHTFQKKCNFVMTLDNVLTAIKEKYWDTFTCQQPHTLSSFPFLFSFQSCIHIEENLFGYQSSIHFGKNTVDTSPMVFDSVLCLLLHMIIFSTVIYCVVPFWDSCVLPCFLV